VIDAAQVKWDDEKIDPAQVKWDEPKTDAKTGFAYTDGRPPRASLAGPLEPRSSLSIGNTGGDLLMGARQNIDALAQMAARTTGLGVEDTERVNREALADYQQRFRPDLRPAASAIGRGAGQALAAAPLMPALPAGGMIAGAAGGAATGAAAGALTPVYEVGDFWMQKGRQAGESAAVGGVLGAAGGAVGKALSPNLAPGAQALHDKGVNLTPGQAFGGMTKGVEDRLSGFPIIGDLVRSAQFRSIKDFDRAIYAKAVEPFGEEGARVAARAEAGNAGIAQIGDFLSSKYQSVLPKMRVGIDGQFVQDMGKLATMAKELPEGQQAQFVAILKNQLVERGLQPGKVISGETMKLADSELGRIAAVYKSSSNPDHRLLSDAVRQAQENLRNLVGRQNPDTKPIVDAANEGWRTLAQMERAGALVGAKDGVFTPAQFLSAGVKRGDKTVRHRGFARGEAWNQEIAQTADRILPNKVPDSGTAGRGLLGLAATGALHMPSAAALSAASVPYLPGVGPLMMNLLTQRPQAIRDMGAGVRSLAPYLGLLASQQP
jgi:hypothetical protein